MLTRRACLSAIAVPWAIELRAAKLPPKPEAAPRGIYVPGWKAVGAAGIERLAALLDRLGLNTVMVDLKNAHGELFFAADNEIGRKMQVKTVDGHRRSLHLSGLGALQRRGFRVLGRHVMFRDRALYQHDADLQLFRAGGEYWVDPRGQEALDYNLTLLEQEQTFGFDELVLDYIRFPAVNSFGTLEAKCDRIDEVVAEVRCRVENLGVQVFGWAAWDYRKAGVGQRIPTLDPHVDHVYPMVYPSHFQKGSFGFAEPNEHPKFILKAGYRAGIQKVSSPKKLIPMVQAFWHEPEQVRAQIEAVEEEGMAGYVAWNAKGDYRLLERSQPG